MKQLDKLLLKLFIGPFLITFIISVFILIMQFLWLYIDDLLGKGVAFSLVLELILYWSSVILPLALPLTILLSSIMTFGNLGEHFELTAVKSAGISLQRFARPLLIAIVLLAIGMVYFQNYVAPKFNLNALALLHDIRQKKPSFDLRPNIFFNELDGYSIRISDKNDKDELFDIMIYDHTDHKGINKYIYAKKGKLKFADEENRLVFELYDGFRTEEEGTRRSQEYENRLATFEKWELSFDQSQFDMKRIDKEAFENNPMLMNGQQLSAYIKRCDTNSRNAQNSIRSVLERQISPERINQYQSVQYQGSQSRPRPTGLAHKDILINTQDLDRMPESEPDTEVFPLEQTDYSPFVQHLPKSRLHYITNKSKSQIKSLMTNLSIQSSNESIYHKQKVAAEIEWHRKYAVSFACILLFVIGASLGSIIRRGGLGLPIIMAVIFFIFYYLMIAFGEKFAKQDKLSPFMGVWFASMILAPLAFFLFRKAVNDSPLLDLDWWSKIWNTFTESILTKLPIKSNDRTPTQ